MLSHIILLGPAAELGGEPALKEGWLVSKQAGRFSRRCAARWLARSS